MTRTRRGSAVDLASQTIELLGEGALFIRSKDLPTREPERRLRRERPPPGSTPRCPSRRSPPTRRTAARRDRRARHDIGLEREPRHGLPLSGRPPTEISWLDVPPAMGPLSDACCARPSSEGAFSGAGRTRNISEAARAPAARTTKYAWLTSGSGAPLRLPCRPHVIALDSRGESVAIAGSSPARCPA